MKTALFIATVLTGCATSAPGFVPLGPPVERLLGSINGERVLEIIPKAGECKPVLEQTAAAASRPANLQLKCGTMADSTPLRWRAGHVRAASGDVCEWAKKAIKSDFTCLEYPRTSVM